MQWTTGSADLIQQDAMERLSTFPMENLQPAMVALQV